LLPLEPGRDARPDATYAGDVSALQLLWGAAVVVTLGALPVGAVRMIAYRSGEVDHTRTMRIAAYVAVALGAAGLVTLAVTSALLFT
jgi:hypothetical protein